MIFINLIIYSVIKIIMTIDQDHVVVMMVVVLVWWCWCAVVACGPVRLYFTCYAY